MIGRLLPDRAWDRALALILVVMVVAFIGLIPGFYAGFAGTLAVTEQFVPFGLVALGLSVVILTGGIDLSVGSIASLTAVIMAVLTKSFGFEIWMASLIAIVAGTVIGWLNGALITWMRIEPLIATLATSFIYTSIATALAGPAPPYGFSKGFALLGTGVVGPLPVQLLLFVAIASALRVLIARTGFGRRVIMVGYNRDAARYAGVDVPALLRRVYAISGMLAAFAGIVLASYYDAVRPNMGAILLLTAVAMVVLGGISIFGGEGSILGVALSVMIIGVLRQGMLIGGYSDMVTTMVTGAILLISIAAKNLLSDRGHGFGARLISLFRSARKEGAP